MKMEELEHIRDKALFNACENLPGIEEWKLVDTAEKFFERNAACPMY